MRYNNAPEQYASSSGIIIKTTGSHNNKDKLFMYKCEIICVVPPFFFYLIVMWWQLVKQLFDAIFLSRAVYIGDLLFW